MNTENTPMTPDSVFREDDRAASPSLFTQVLTSLQNITTVSEALRVLGAGALLASMVVYLLQGWDEGNDISRYFLLLAQTGLLGAAGFALSHGLREPRGARVFFGLALVSIPANFTILGALLYSVFQWDGGLSYYPSFATWQIDDLANVGMTIVAALAVLVPVTAFCFAIMARHSTSRLTLTFLGLNLLLLIPVRGSLVAGTIALVGVAVAATVSRRLLRDNSALTTAEGRFALATLFVPMAIMLVRSLYFYDTDSLIVAMLAAAVFAALRQSALLPERSDKLAAALDAASIPVAAVAALALGDYLAPALSDGLTAPLMATTFALFGIDLVRRSRASSVRQFAATLVSGALAAGFALGAATNPTVLTAGLAFVVGIGLVVAGTWFNFRTATWAGAIAIAAGALFGFEPLVELVVFSSWITLAVAGAIIITVASVLERHGTAWIHHGRGWLKKAAERNSEVVPSD